jgi:hypothetical protein
MDGTDVRDTWNAECHATPTHKYCCCCYRSQHHQHQVEVEQLRAQLAAQAADGAGEAARYRAALTWYADEANYDTKELYSDDPRLRANGVTYRSRPIMEDEGERARAALAAAPPAPAETGAGKP